MKQNTEPVEKNNKTKSWILDYINKIIKHWREDFSARDTGRGSLG